MMLKKISIWYDFESMLLQKLLLAQSLKDPNSLVISISDTSKSQQPRKSFDLQFY